MKTLIEAECGEHRYMTSARACDYAKNNPKEDVYVKHNGIQAKVYENSFAGDISEKLYLLHELNRLNK